MRPPPRLAIAALLGMGLTACPAEPPVPPPDGGGGEEGGLSIVWEGRPPALPAEVSGDLTIDRVTFRLDDLRVVGDGGSIDIDLKDLAWSSAGAPGPVPVLDASPGRYSRLAFELDGDDEGELAYAFEIEGKVKVNNVTSPFTIHDTSDLALSLECTIELEVGKPAQLRVRVDLGKLAEVVDFGSLTPTNGRYVVEDGSELDKVRDEAKKAFDADKSD
jgi:hypothetical protein